MKPPWLPDALAAALVLAVLFMSLTSPADPDPLWQRLGAMLMVTSLPFIFLPFRRLSRDGGVPDSSSYMETTRVVRTGIYGIVRHPQYVGYCLLLSGLAIRRQSLPAILVAVAALAMFGWQMAREEEFLLSRFGDAYRTYASKVPRWNFIAGIWRRVR